MLLPRSPSHDLRQAWSCDGGLVKCALSADPSPTCTLKCGPLTTIWSTRRLLPEPQGSIWSEATPDLQPIPVLLAAQGLAVGRELDRDTAARTGDWREEDRAPRRQVSLLKIIFFFKCCFHAPPALPPHAPACKCDEPPLALPCLLSKSITLAEAPSQFRQQTQFWPE